MSLLKKKMPLPLSSSGFANPLNPKNTDEQAVQFVDVKWVNYGNSLNQIYSSGLEYAFVDANLTQSTPFAYCKDYLQDAVYSTIHDSPVSIYGFTYDKKKNPPIDLETTRIALVNSKDPNLDKKIPQMLDFLHQVESILKMKKTKISLAKTTPSNKYNCALILEGSCKWELAPPLISMYSLLIRLSMSHPMGQSFDQTLRELSASKIKGYQSNDISQIKQARKGIDDILTWGYPKIFFKDIDKNYPKGCNVNTMHNSMGICAFANGETKNQVKHWHRDMSKPPKAKADKAA